MSNYLFRILIVIAALTGITASASAKKVNHTKEVSIGPFQAGHVQGIAVDKKNGYIYYSFTTMLVKSDMQGHILGSVTGFIGHLGCLTFNEEDGRVYGSLEYKDDEIGQGVQRMQGTNKKFPNAWYIAIFDGSKITRENMDYSQSGVMTTIYLPTVVADYEAVVNGNKNRYGCRGIDGVTFGPAFGQKGGKKYLTCAYGVFMDRNRNDNNYMVLLQYDTDNWKTYESPLTQDHLHTSGPASPVSKNFVYTGTTSWGVQNLCYDSFTGNWLMFVYPGNKPTFLNHNLYIVDGHKAPVMSALKNSPENEQGLVLSLVQDGLYDKYSGIYGWESRYGATGAASLGNGYFYLTHNRVWEGKEYAEVHLYQWTGFTPTPFRMVK